MKNFPILGNLLILKPIGLMIILNTFFKDKSKCVFINFILKSCTD